MPGDPLSHQGQHKSLVDNALPQEVLGAAGVEQLDVLLCLLQATGLARGRAAVVRA